MNKSTLLNDAEVTAAARKADKDRTAFLQLLHDRNATTNESFTIDNATHVWIGICTETARPIWFKSDIGNGSTFTFSVRLSLESGVPHPASLNREKAKGLSASGALSSPLAEEESIVRVLLAEHSEDNLFLVQSSLTDSGFQLDKVTKGKRRAESFISRKYSLIPMDGQIPVMCRHAATQAIRQGEKQTQSPPVPIQLVTAHALEAAVTASEEASSGPAGKAISRKCLQANSSNIGPRYSIGYSEGNGSFCQREAYTDRRSWENTTKSDARGIEPSSCLITSPIARHSDSFCCMPSVQT